MAGTNVPQVTFGPNGFIAPPESAVLTGTLADILAAFAAAGFNLNPALTTPQGQIALSNAAIIGNVNATFLLYTQQVDPAYSTGRMQDAIGRIYFITRNPAQATVVQCLCTGLAGVAIPTGALAADESGNVYACVEGGTIPVGGGITLSFANQAVGPIPCAEGTLTTIYQAIPGWDSIVNLEDGVLGNLAESRAAFEARRAASVGVNSGGALGSILGAVLSVSGVIDAYVTENDTNAPVTVGGYTLAENSVYVAVAGGAPSAIAQAIWSRKAPGCAYNGNTTVDVQDPNPAYNGNGPIYPVTYEVPASLSVLFAVTLVNNSGIPSNAVSLIQNAIISAFAGGDGGPKVSIGGTVLASRFYSTVASLGPWALIESLYVGSNNEEGAVFSGTISGNTLTVTEVFSGTIAIGQVLSDTTGLVTEGTLITGGSGSSWDTSPSEVVAGASFTGNASGANLTASAVTGTIVPGMAIHGTGVPSNTTILSQTSGTVGGAGVYVTSVATTASSAALTADDLFTAATPNLNSVTVNINQIPTIAAANIQVATT